MTIALYMQYPKSDNGEPEDMENQVIFLPL